MKGQQSLIQLMAGERPKVSIGTRFLYRDHGSKTALLEGTLHEIVRDAEDGDAPYVRLDDSGEWVQPHECFVEFIFPAPVPKAAAPSVEPAPVPAPPPVPIPINNKTAKHKSKP